MTDGREPPDLVLMRLVHADGFVPVKPGLDRDQDQDQDSGGRSSPHYSSPLPGRGEPTGGLEEPHSPDLTARPEPGPGPGPGPSQIRVLPDADTGSSSAEPDAAVAPGSWTPPSSDPNGAFSMWPPALLDQALRLGLLDPCAAPRLFDGSAPSGPWEALKDPEAVLALARRLGQVGEEREAGNCSCHGSTAARPPDERLLTSAALLVLQGLEGRGSERTGLNRSLDRISARGPELCAERGSRSQPQSRASTPKLSLASGGRSLSPLRSLDSDKHSSRSRGKSRKGSLKVRLSKLFRTRSSGAGPGLDKRPSLASSTSSGGSLLDVWGSGSSTQDQDPSR